MKGFLSARPLKHLCSTRRHGRAHVGAVGGAHRHQRVLHAEGAEGGHARDRHLRPDQVRGVGLEVAPGHLHARLGQAGTGLFDDPTQATLTFEQSDPDEVIDPLNPADNNRVKWADGLGIAAQTLTLDLNTSAGGLSQLNTASVVQSTITNGTAFGNLSEIAIDDQGFVTAIFDNGVMRRIAQVAVALLSERFGRYVVGTTVEVDGGIGLMSWIPAKA